MIPRSVPTHGVARNDPPASLRVRARFSLLALLAPGLAPADSPKGGAGPIRIQDGRDGGSPPRPSSKQARRRPSSDAPPAYLGILVDPDAKGPDLSHRRRRPRTRPPTSRRGPAGRRPPQARRQGRKADGEAMAEVDRRQGRRPARRSRSSSPRGDRPIDTSGRCSTPWSPDDVDAGPAPVGPRGPGRGERQGGGRPDDRARQCRGRSPDRARLKVGEVLIKLDDVALTGPDQLYDLVDSKPSEATIVTTLRLAEKAVDLKIKLDADPSPETRPGGFGGGNGNGRRWWWWRWSSDGAPTTGPSRASSLAIVCVEYPDVKHNPVITNEAWEQAPLQRRDIHQDQRDRPGRARELPRLLPRAVLRLFPGRGEGLQLDRGLQEAARNTPPAIRTALLTESLDKLLEPATARTRSTDFDGDLLRLRRSTRYPGPRGQPLLAPPGDGPPQGEAPGPTSSVRRRRPEDAGDERPDCHEFGHMLGMPDLYARPENPGMEGLGVLVQYVAAARSG